MTYTQLYAVICLPLLLAGGACRLLWAYTHLDDPLVYASSVGVGLAFSLLGYEIEGCYFRHAPQPHEALLRVGRFVAGLPLLYALSLGLLALAYLFPQVPLLLSLCVFLLSSAGGLYILLSDNHIRGRRIHTQRYAQKLGQGALPPEDPGFPFSGVPVPMKQSLHRAYIGTTGSGKTTAIKEDLSRILPLIGKGPDSLRAAIWDPKTELFGFMSKIATCPVYTTHPFDIRGRSWALCKDIRTPKAVLQFAFTLIPKQEGPNSFFSNAARLIVQRVLLSFILNTPDDWTFRDLLLACETEPALRAILYRNRITKPAIAKYLDAREKSGVLAELGTFTEDYAPIAGCWAKAEPISLRDFCQGNSIILFAQDEQAPEALALINSLMIRYLIQELLSHKTNDELRREGKPQRQTFLFLDELRELAGRIPVPLTNALTRGRGYGLTCINGWLSNPGLKDALNPNRAAEIIGMHSLLGVLRLQDEDTGSFISGLLGDREVGRLSKTIGQNGTSRSYQITHEKLLPVTDLTVLPTGTGYFFGPPPVGAWKATLPPPVDKTHDDTTVPNFLPRPEYGILLSENLEVHEPHQWLEPWNEEDLKRLKLPLQLLNDKDGQQRQGAARRPPPPPPGQSRLQVVDVEQRR
jgi:hypothetical protein